VTMAHTRKSHVRGKLSRVVRICRSHCTSYNGLWNSGLGGPGDLTHPVYHRLVILTNDAIDFAEPVCVTQR